MKLLRHPVAALILFAVLIGLCITIYDGFKNAYSFEENDILTLEVNNETSSGNVVYHLRRMNLIDGINQIQEGIRSIKPPTGSGLNRDLLGGLASVGVGAIKSVIGLVTTPFEIVGIILEFYTKIPSIITELVMIVVVYVGFILLSAYLKQDV